uniref:Uncharacterized protein n=1 Tax=Lepeophtheirus salmonis TaxID=72036 RepID=A0A0K2V174_LEPSM
MIYLYYISILDLLISYHSHRFCCARFDPSHGLPFCAL